MGILLRNSESHLQNEVSYKKKNVACRNWNEEFSRTGFGTVEFDFFKYF